MRDIHLLGTVPGRIRHLAGHVKEHGVGHTCKKAFSKSYHTIHTLYFAFVWFEGHGLYALTGGVLCIFSVIMPFLALG